LYDGSPPLFERKKKTKLVTLQPTLRKPQSACPIPLSLSLSLFLSLSLSFSLLHCTKRDVLARIHHFGNAAMRKR
jgi:hypothetical protein